MVDAIIDYIFLRIKVLGKELWVICCNLSWLFVDILISLKMVWFEAFIDFEAVTSPI